MSETISNAIGDDLCEEVPETEIIEQEWPEVPCALVSSVDLAHITNYCAHFNYERGADHIPQPVPDGHMSAWADVYEVELIESLELPQLMSLLKAANYLNIPAIFELCCAAVALTFNGKNYAKLKREMGQFAE